MARYNKKTKAQFQVPTEKLQPRLPNSRLGGTWVEAVAKSSNGAAVGWKQSGETHRSSVVLGEELQN